MTQFAAIDPALAAVLMAVAVAAGLLRAWITHRTAVRMEEEHTRRICVAVEGSTPIHRAAVVRACAELEAASWTGPHLTRRPVQRRRVR
ncbi:hypothetical protein [Streptomyces sp. NBC_01481]|uniref:hypothetical protein n=1 Tax=Streptomyces sp. NBC_01481 TaxID=2975869 RepID=UPI00225322F9|nr:hypothetical protein [Streptomyces sp. NBC_01481]MCX4582681.1 hypothetical protein [Streptomyces sp. NBC_01481]